MTRRTWWVLGIVLAVALTGCGGEDGDDAGSEANVGSGDAGTQPAGDPLATPKGSIEHQLALIRAGKAEELRACFTPRGHSAITAEAVKKAQGEVGSMSIGDLWASATEGEWQGNKTMKVKMKNGRTLTTLVLVDGQWLADTIWFR